MMFKNLTDFQIQCLIACMATMDDDGTWENPEKAEEFGQIMLELEGELELREVEEKDPFEEPDWRFH